jgi:hypothetical protein
MTRKENKKSIDKLKFSEGFQKGVDYLISSKEDIEKFMIATGGLGECNILESTKWCT